MRERAMIAARTKAALGVKKARGECTGTPPYGFRVGDNGKTLVADEGERETARRLCSLRGQGWPYRQIRDEAKRLGMTSRAGRPLTLRAVFDLTKDAAVTTPITSRTAEFLRAPGIVMESAVWMYRKAAVRQKSVWSGCAFDRTCFAR